MNCQECEAELVRYVENMLSAEVTTGVELHLADCSACRREADQIRALQRRLVRDSQPARGVAMDSKVMDQIIRQQAAELRKTTMQKRHTPITRRRALAAAILVVGVTAVVGLLTLSGGGSGIAWADVQAHVRGVKTVTCRLTVSSGGAGDIEMRRIQF